MYEWRVSWTGQGTEYLKSCSLFTYFLFTYSISSQHEIGAIFVYTLSIFRVGTCFVSFVSTVGPQYICVRVKHKQRENSPASKLIFDD